jgi:hypothetical protein
MTEQQSRPQVDCVDCVAAEEGTETEQQPAMVSTKSVEEDIMNPSTFTPPDLSVGPAITIEYCDRVSMFPLDLRIKLAPLTLSLVP